MSLNKQVAYWLAQMMNLLFVIILFLPVFLDQEYHIVFYLLILVAIINNVIVIFYLKQ